MLDATAFVGKSTEEIQALLAEFRREMEAKRGVGNIKISAKGAVSVYSLGRWPVTLYASQWDALFERADEIKAFIAANREKLAVKPAKAEATPATTEVQ